MKQTRQEHYEGTHTVTDFIECDLCHRRNKGDGWATGEYDVRNVTVSMNLGESYPDGGYGDLVEYDICPDCFEKRIMPWLLSQGATPRKIEWG